MDEPFDKVGGWRVLLLALRAFISPDLSMSPLELKDLNSLASSNTKASSCFYSWEEYGLL